MIGLAGVYRSTPRAGLARVTAHRAAAATIRSLPGRIADAITDPAARSRDAGRAAIRPGPLALASPGPPDSRRTRLSQGRPRPAGGQQRVNERARLHPVAADPRRLDLHYLSRGPAAVGTDPEPAGDHRPPLDLD